MQNFLSSYAYPLGVTVCALALYLAGYLSIKKKLLKRLKGAKKKEIFDPVYGETPSEIDQKEILNLGMDSIRSRFSFIQKLLPALLFLIWAVLMAVPYLSTLPAIYISLVAAIVSVTAGIALRPFLENLVAGVILSFFQPFKVGDTVRIDGHYGVIERIDLAQCVLRVWDWQRFVIPNSKMLTKEFQNLTMHDSLIWAYVSFWVEPACDIDLVEKLALEGAKASGFSLNSEEPVFWINAMEKNSIECWVAAWADNPSEAWELKCDIRRSLIKSLQKNNIKFHSSQVNLQEGRDAASKSEAF